MSLEIHSDFPLPTHQSTCGVISIWPFPFRPWSQRVRLGREKVARHPTSVPPALTQASRNVARLALLLTDKCDACPEPQHSARAKPFSSCLRKSKSTEQKGNLEDYNCAIRVSRGNPSRLLCFSLCLLYSCVCTKL